MKRLHKLYVFMVFIFAVILLSIYKLQKKDFQVYTMVTLNAKNPTILTNKKHPSIKNATTPANKEVKIIETTFPTTPANKKVQTIEIKIPTTLKPVLTQTNEEPKKPKTVGPGNVRQTSTKQIFYRMTYEPNSAKDKKESVFDKKHITEEWTSTVTLTSDDDCPAVVKTETAKNKSVNCRIPELDPFHPSIMQFIHKTQYPYCPGTTHGVLQNGVLKFTDPNVVSASYQPILRDGDFKYRLGASFPVGESNITDEFMEVDYYLKDGRVVKDFLYQVLRKQSLLDRKAAEKPGIPINILTIGIDSLSYGNTRRKLPLLYDFLNDDLNALFYKGHTVVGDGTTPQLTAFLTGKHVEEQYEARTGRAGARQLDDWSWIFKELKEHGYLTGFSEDGIWDGPFQYRLKGFDKPPTDFYPRPYFLDIARHTKLWSDRCINNRNVPQIHLEYARCVFDAFPNKLKFFMSFNAGFSHHEINNVKKNERAVLALLKDFKAKGYLNNTLLIVMGDHGLRFGRVRQQVQGKLEERLPLYAMAVPSWFPSRYPHIYKMMEINTARLTSWFDVHATFQHILNYPTPPQNNSRGISLFTEVPASRTCKDAGIANHWCPCLEWTTVDVKHSHVQHAAKAAVEYINHFVGKENASLASCVKLALKTVNFAQLERPNEEVVKAHLGTKARFKQSEEYFCRYQLQFVTTPNEGVYEATVKFHKKRFIVNTSISRINKYGDQPKCVADKLPHVRKFCLCKDFNSIII